MSEIFILVPGRSSQQGSGINEGKFSDTYLRATTVLQVCGADMSKLGLADGDFVRLSSSHGSIEIEVATSKGDELVPGLLFVGYGDLSSRLMGGDTHGSGMPTSKGIDVTIERIDSNSD